MRQTNAPRSTSRASRLPTAVNLVLVGAAIVGVVVDQASSAAARSADPAGAPATDVLAPLRTQVIPLPPRAARPGDAEPAINGGGVGTDDGALPAGVSVFDDRYPGITGLDLELLDALRVAAKDAAREGLEIHVASGWRSPELQEALLRAAVSEYGSIEEAARWVASPETSPHVSGEAVDLGPDAAVAWLAAHGDRYGLCQIYRNEPWHFELRTEAIEGGCPRRFADASRDPRLQP